jgi:hypothetical protein
LSFRFLYKRVPVQDRRCAYCERVIQRNIVKDKNGLLYHWGCLQDAREEKHQCLECFATFDATEATWETSQSSYNDDFRENRKPVCPHCGSINLKNLSNPEPMEA